MARGDAGHSRSGERGSLAVAQGRGAGRADEPRNEERNREERRQGRGRVATGQKDIWLCIMYSGPVLHTPPFLHVYVSEQVCVFFCVFHTCVGSGAHVYHRILMWCTKVCASKGSLLTRVS